MDSNNQNDGYNIGGLNVTDDDVLLWADRLAQPQGDKTRQLVLAMVQTVKDQIVSGDTISDRQIHELRGGAQVLRTLNATLSKIATLADEIRESRKLKAGSL